MVLALVLAMREPKIHPQIQLGELVAQYSVTAEILRHHRLDYCCKGKQTLEEACLARSLSVEALSEKLSEAINRSERDEEQEERLYLNIHEGESRRAYQVRLVDHIVKTYHHPLRDQLPFLVELSSKVARVHGEQHPELLSINELVNNLSSMMSEHLDQEELEWFPHILSTESSVTELKPMQSEHLEVAAILEKLREHSEQYTAPEDSCASYRTLYAELDRLESETMRHVHLENQLLASLNR